MILGMAKDLHREIRQFRRKAKKPASTGFLGENVINNKKVDIYELVIG